METVSLISAGYEWTCPHCDTLNHEIEITETVACEQCGVEFEVSDADHAYE
jgi:uncharacterized protein (DUF983 family)